jgi:hypothetical protein
MYRLMMSKKSTLAHMVIGSMPSYRQIQVNHFQQFSAALTACETANDEGESFHYVLNESDKEYYKGAWID